MIEVFCLEKLFGSNLKCEHDSNFTAWHQVNNMVEEQFQKLNLDKMTELGLSVIHLKD